MQLYILPIIIIGTLSPLLMRLLYLAVALWLARNDRQRKDQLFKAMLNLLKPRRHEMLHRWLLQHPKFTGSKVKANTRLPSQISAPSISGSNLPHESAH